MHRAFTLIEVLVVIAIIAVLAGLLFPVLSQAKDTAKKASCASNIRQIGLATLLYIDEYGGTYPQVKQTTVQPEVDDADGSLEDPSYGSVFAKLYPYTSGGQVVHEVDVSRQPLFVCPSDPSPGGPDCATVNPDSPPVTSYLINGFFVWGMNESAVATPASTIDFSERRSVASGSVDPYCDDLYHPWFNPTNEDAPANEMDPAAGAVAAYRHTHVSNFGFVDGHAKAMPWQSTFDPPRVNLHSPR